MPPCHCVNGIVVNRRAKHVLWMYVGSHQTPQQIWAGLESILPALRDLLTSCNTVSLSGMSSIAACLNSSMTD